MRLRDTIKQLLVAVLYVGIPFVLSNIALKWLPDGAGMAPLRNGFKIVVLIAAYLGYVRWVERRAPFELSLHGAPKEAGVGFLLGASVIGVSVAVLAGLGVYRVDGINLEVTWIRYLVTFLAVAILEEMIFRVLLFRLIEKSLGSVLAIILSTAVFGLAHLINPNASWIAAVSLTLSSVILVAGFVLTRRLWLCMGLHWSWNLTQALCSLPVSGSETTGLLKGHTSGSVWLSGGGFGIEASVVTLVFSVMTAGTLFYFAGQRGRFIARHSAAHEIRTKKAAVA
ncbi:MAG TPA: type II CAAX endopeptidase family protein [Steroidobacteraceae bacterium]|jgi:membrane protease YdiL (CAAX protease family)|nr:type II CAAX endopeptidase family protein [Steroidobacteraceae bacterium]